MIETKAPAYPAIAHAAHAEGTVKIEIEIARNGTVGTARAISGHPLLQAVSIKAAREWKFEPVPEVSRADLTFDFVDSFLVGSPLLPADTCREGYVAVDPYHLRIYGYKKVEAVSEVEDDVPEGMEGTFCKVHRHEVLRRDRVEIMYGLTESKPGYLKAEKKLFPNANVAAYGGCVVETQIDACNGTEVQLSPKYAAVLYCAACRRAQERWSKSHPWPGKS